MGLRLVASDTGQHRPPSLTNEADVRQAYDAHVGELYRFALRATGDQGSSQDIVQETFLRAWRSAAKFDPALASLRVWLFAIARNVITDHHRAAGVRPRLRALADEPADTGSAVAAGRRRRTRGLRSAGAVLVAASVIVLMVIGVASLIDRTPAAPTPEVVAVVVASDLDSVSATAGLIAHTWGTEVKLQTTGLDEGATYQAVALGVGDQEFPAGTVAGTGPNTINCNLQASGAPG